MPQAVLPPGRGQLQPLRVAGWLRARESWPMRMRPVCEVVRVGQRGETPRESFIV